MISPLNNEKIIPFPKGQKKAFPVNAAAALPMASGTADTAGNAPRPLLFDLDPFFSGEYLDSKNKTFFSHGTGKPGRDGLIKLRTSGNAYLDNELRGFVQHLVVDRKMAARTLLAVVWSMFSQFASFITERHPEYVSIIDYDLEELLAEFEQHVLDRGEKTVWNGPRVVDGDMNIRKYTQKSAGVYNISRMYRYISDIVYPDTTPERVKDIWDVRLLGIPFSTPENRPRYTVNFAKITQPWFKDTAKRYAFYRLQRRTMAAVLDDLKGFNIFSRFLREKHPEIQSFSEIDRDIIKDFFTFLNGFGYSNTVYNRRISVMKTFFEIGNLLGFDGFPAKEIIFVEDYVKIVHHVPNFFTDNELRQMNEHLKELPVQHGRAFFILENCGMRTSDLFSSPIIIDGEFCLKESGDDGFVFTYMMPKVHRTNSIPVNEIVGNVILSAIEYSREMYGEDCRYIFAKSKTRPICNEAFVRAMNEMSKKYDLRKDDGTPLRIRGHTFRGTVATQYANSGINLELIRLMLGQRKLGVLKHYITIHSETMLGLMQNITDTNDQLIRSIGNVDASVIKENDEGSMRVLPNGVCGRAAYSEGCRKANACYKCRMFHPRKEFLYIYKDQLCKAEANIEMAELHGYAKIAEENRELAKTLKKIISDLEG